MLLLREVGDVLNIDEGRLLNILWGILVGVFEFVGLEWIGGRFREGDFFRFDRFFGVFLLGVLVFLILFELVFFFRVFIFKFVGLLEYFELLIVVIFSFWRLGFLKLNNNDLLVKFGVEVVEIFWWFVEKDFLRLLEWVGGIMSVFGEDVVDDEVGDMLEVWRFGDGFIDFESG